MIFFYKVSYLRAPVINCHLLVESPKGRLWRYLPVDNNSFGPEVPAFGCKGILSRGNSMPVTPSSLVVTYRWVKSYWLIEYYYVSFRTLSLLQFRERVLGRWHKYSMIKKHPSLLSSQRLPPEGGKGWDGCLLVTSSSRLQAPLSAEPDSLALTARY
jgi:hypothetical protein